MSLGVKLATQSFVVLTFDVPAWCILVHYAWVVHAGCQPQAQAHLYTSP